MNSRSTLLLFIGILILSSCSTQKTKIDADTVLNSLPSEVRNKKVALIHIEAEDTQRKITEVALINQLLKKGSFLLIPKKEVEAARQSATATSPSDSLQIAKNLNADYALEVKVIEFETKIHEGYNREKKYDSLLAKEQGEKAGMSEELVKVKSLEARYRAELFWINTETGEKLNSQAYAKDQVTQAQKDRAISLPPRMRFMENLANHAFEVYFSK